MSTRNDYTPLYENDFATDVIKGLSQTSRAIPSKWLYNTQGSALFEKITEVDDYYLTRTEAAIFEAVFPALNEYISEGGAIAEFGSGASLKTRNLLKALKPQCYVPIDIAEDFLKEAVAGLQALFPTLKIAPVVADLTQTYQLPDDFQHIDTRLGFFPGSTIGNFTEDVAITFLERAKHALGTGSKLLISADLVKDRDILERAYDDREGITPQFTMNLLHRMNQELDGNFDIQNFKHVALFNELESRIEIYVESLVPQNVTVADEAFDFEMGARIRTEYSYKYTPQSFETLLQKSGWALDKLWTDQKDWFGVFLASC